MAKVLAKEAQTEARRDERIVVQPSSGSAKKTISVPEDWHRKRSNASLPQAR
jgi:hypothetical protein